MATAKRISRILVPFDFEPASYRALDVAKTIAEGCEARIDLLYIVPALYSADPSLPIPEVTGFALPDGFFDQAVKDAGQRLEHVLAGVDTKKVKGKGHIGLGDPRKEIIDHAASEEADLIVMGTHGRSGVERMFLGSVADRVVVSAQCPVLTVK